MTIDATFWVAVSFFIFLGGLIYLKVPQKVNNSLAEQIQKMKKELDEAEILKVEAIVQFVNQNGEYGFIEYPPRHIYFNRSKVFPIADFEKIISGSKVKVTFNKSAAQFFDSEKETEKPKSYAARSVTLSK